MPIQLLDVILGGIMVISGLLALMRGFTREVLSLVAWGLAAVAAYFAIINPDLKKFAQQYVNDEVLATIAVGATAFLVVLIVVSIISIKISDQVLDTAAGAFDRTVGFVYGLARGLVLVVIAYLLFIWWVPIENRPDMVRQAYSLSSIETVGRAVISFLPSDLAASLTSQLDPNATASASSGGNAAPSAEEGGGNYQQDRQRELDRLIEGTNG